MSGSLLRKELRRRIKDDAGAVTSCTPASEAIVSSRQEPVYTILVLLGTPNNPKRRPGTCPGRLRCNSVPSGGSRKRYVR